jgi:uncharacterized protein (DUF2132 family)
MKKELKPMDEQGADLLSARGFDKCFFRMLGMDGVKTQRQAWEKVEAMYVEYFGKNKYKNFESFTMAKNRRVQR